MRTLFKPLTTWALALFLAAGLTGCGYNDFQRLDEQSKSAWSEVLNQYQRRADLVPNLVNTVKGFAAQEQQILIQVTEARARVGSMQATPELINDPEAFAKFQAAHLFRVGLDTAVGKHGFERGAHRGMPHHPGTTRVHADDVVLVGPAGHEAFEVAVLQGVVERVFGVVGGTGGQFGFAHGSHFAA